MDIATIILSIGSVSSAILALIALSTALFKKPKEWIKKWVVNLTKEELQTHINPIAKKIDKLFDNEKTRLGHSIITIYDRSVNRGFLTIADKKDLQELYTAYKNVGGNHHIDGYYTLLMGMQRESQEVT